MSFLRLDAKKILITGVANRKSVAFHIAKVLKEENAELIFSVQNDEQSNVLEKFFPGCSVYKCDVSDEADITRLAESVKAEHGSIYGLVHSIAFANYSEGIKAFHATLKQDFLQAVDVSCFSFIKLVDCFKEIMDPDGAIITISISTTSMAAESYGYMAPIKAALDSSVRFLAKSMSADSRVRVNSVGAAPLKTSSSAGIPGYIEPYLFSEQATLRKQAVKTEEVADVAAFLLSPRSTGINAQTIVVDAGMSTNYFDRDIVKKVIN